jgi:hypothetical protein
VQRAFGDRRGFVGFVKRSLAGLLSRYFDFFSSGLTGSSNARCLKKPKRENEGCVAAGAAAAWTVKAQTSAVTDTPATIAARFIVCSPQGKTPTCTD